MKNREICSFYENLINSGKFNNELLRKLRLVTDETDLKSFIKSEIMPFVRDAGLDFSVDDLVNYEKEVAKNLKETDLESISGGAVPKFLTIAGTASLMVLGAGLASAIPTHAAISQKMVLASTAEIDKDTATEQMEEPAAAAPPMQVALPQLPLATVGTEGATAPAVQAPTAGVQVSSEGQPDEKGTPLSENPDAIASSAKEVAKRAQSTDKKYIADALNFLDPYVQKLTGVTQAFRLFDGNKESVAVGGESAVPGWLYNRDKGAGSPTFMRMLFPSSDGTLNCAGGADDGDPFTRNVEPTPETIARIAACMYRMRRGEDVVKSYDGLIEGLENAKKKLDESKNKEKKANESLTGREGKIKRFEKLIDENIRALSQELDEEVNLFVENGELSEEAIKKLENIAEMKNKKTADEAKKIVANIKNFKDQLTRIKATNEESLQSALDLAVAEVKKGEKELEAQRKEINKFSRENLGIDDAVTIRKNGKIEVSGKAKTILNLLKNARTMIQEQEYSEKRENQGIFQWLKYMLGMGYISDKYNPKEPDRNLPKYTTERMLMAYFIEHFNTQDDVQRFYSEARKLIKTSEDGDATESLGRLEDLKTVIQTLKVSDYTPYKSATIRNGSTRAIEMPTTDETGNRTVKFSNDNFADCADIAQRHMMNLLLYSANKDWAAVLGAPSQAEQKTMNDELNELTNAIKTGGEIPFKSLKERLQLFYWHQKEVGVDAGDITTRTLWNYVISNMDKNVESGMYEVKYVNGNYEFETGFLNSLKLTYNMAYALKSEDEANNDALQNAKKAIDSLVEEVKTNEVPKEKLEEDLKNAFNLLLKFLNQNAEVAEISDLEIMNGELCGKAKVVIDCTEEKIGFILGENIGHAWVEHSPLPNAEFNVEATMKLEEIARENQTALLYLKNARWDKVNGKELDRFNQIFWGKRKVSVSTDDQYYKKTQTLRSFFNIQEEENNSVRVFMELGDNTGWIDSGDRIGVTDSKGKKLKGSVNLRAFIFKNYVDINDLTDIESLKKKFPILLNEMLDDAGAVVDNTGNFKFIIDDGNTVTIYPTDKLKDEKNITIPGELKIGKGKNERTIKVSGIGKFAFVGFDKLKFVKVESPDSLLIGPQCFWGCKNFETFEVTGKPQKVDIGVGAFTESGIQAFTAEMAENGELKIGGSKGVFFRCIKFKTFAVTGQLKTLDIGEDAFFGSAIQSFTVAMAENGVLKIERRAFAGCRNLETFVVTVGTLKTLDIGENAFGGTGIESFTVAMVTDGELKIGDYAFHYCKFLKTFAVTTGTLKKLDIGERAFDVGSIQSFTAAMAEDGELSIAGGAFPAEFEADISRTDANCDAQA